MLFAIHPEAHLVGEFNEVPFKEFRRLRGVTTATYMGEEK